KVRKPEYRQKAFFSRQKISADQLNHVLNCSTATDRHRFHWLDYQREPEKRWDLVLGGGGTTKHRFWEPITAKLELTSPNCTCSDTVAMGAIAGANRGYIDVEHWHRCWELHLALLNRNLISEF